MQANNANFQGYNKALRPVAHKLRNEATLPEIHLWKHVLRAGAMMGYTFRRQRPVLNYVADFMCQPLMLIIELDGSVHRDDEVAANDARRQAALEAAGFSVLRFTNEMVMQRTSSVRQCIEGWIDSYEAIHGLPERAARMKRLRGL